MVRLTSTIDIVRVELPSARERMEDVRMESGVRTALSRSFEEIWRSVRRSDQLIPMIDTAALLEFSAMLPMVSIVGLDVER